MAINFPVTVRRWCDLSCLSLVSALIVFMLTSLVGNPTVIIQPNVGRWSFGFQVIIGILISSLLATAILRMSSRFLTIAHFFRYPSTAVAVIAGALICFAMSLLRISGSNGAFLECGAEGFAELALGFGLAWLQQQLTPRNSSPYRNFQLQGVSSVAQESEDLSENTTALEEWIERESPEDEPSRDFFGARPVAQRIAKQILFSNSPLATFGLFGAFGTGKSTLLRIVESYLRNPTSLMSETPTMFAPPPQGPKELPKVWTCWVDGWGMEGPSAADYILKRAIQEVGRHVDVLALANLPASYTAAISSAGIPIAASIMHLLPTNDSPIDVLNSLDRVLRAVHGRLVIFLEDFDRNTSLTAKAVSDQVPALLDRFRHLQRVTFVFAQGTENAEVFQRVCDYQEAISPIDPITTWKILQRFNTLCLQISADDLNPSPSSEGYFFTEMSDYFVAQGIIQGQGNAQSALASILATPRALKHTLRRTMSAWRVVHGEVDFVGLLILNAIRVAEPTAFNFLISHFESIQNITTGINGFHRLVNMLKRRGKKRAAG